jgi:uncharacterized protein YjiS (DUF1127 family)
MTSTHRDLNDLARRCPSPATMAAAGNGPSATLSFVGLWPHVGRESRMRRALARAAAAALLWHERARQRCALLELSDYMLCDIGISRPAAISEAGKPFWHD